MPLYLPSSLSPWQFTPESYGARGDGIVGNGGAGNTGTATFTDSGAAFTSADVGKTIMINGGAGSSAAPLVTTISAVGSATSITLGANLTATVSAAAYIYGTDDTAAINSAVSAASTYAQANQWYAEIVFRPLNYMVASGPTQTAASGAVAQQNSQIPLPYPNVNGTTRKLVLKFAGTAGDSATAQYFDATIPNLVGTCLVSTVSMASGGFGAASVIGGPSAATGLTGGFVNTGTVIDNITVVCGWNFPQLGFDFRFCASMSILRGAYQAFASVGGNAPKLSTKATNLNGVGLYCPLTTNNDKVDVWSFTVENVATGIAFAEHLTAQRLEVSYATYGLFAVPHNASQHGAGINYASVESCTNALYCQSAGSSTKFPISIGLLDCESITTHVNESGNTPFYGRVMIYDDTASTITVGATNAPNLEIINAIQARGVWGSPPAVPATGVAQLNTAWRHAWVNVQPNGATISAIAVGGTTLTGITSGPVRVPSGQTITLSYTVATPAWQWILD